MKNLIKRVLRPPVHFMRRNFGAGKAARIAAEKKIANTARLKAKEEAKQEAIQKKKIADGILEKKATSQWLRSYHPSIADGFKDVPGFNLLYWIKMLDVWEQHKFNLADPYPLMNVVEEYLNVSKGQRHTTGQPKHSTNTIYMLGSDMVFGMYVLDKHTSSSYLQKRCEEAFPSRYKVVNLGYSSRNIWVDMIKFNDLQLMSGDFVILQLAREAFDSLIKMGICDVLVAMNHICKNKNATFVFLLTPSPFHIINPSIFEKGLSYLPYYQLMNGVSSPTKADKRRLWAESQLLVRLRNQGCLVEDLSPYFARPHHLGELFLNKWYMLPNSYDEISRIIFERYIDESSHQLQAPAYNIALDGFEYEKNIGEDETIFLDFAPFVYHICRHHIAQNRLDKARKLLKESLLKYSDLKLYYESLRLSFLMGDDEWCYELFEMSEELEFTIADLYKMKLLFRKKAYSSYKLIERPFFSHLGERYLKDLELIKERGGEVLVVVVFSGPGDEIRFTKLYPLLVQILENCSFRFLCDPRLFSIFKRSMPELSFIQTYRNIRNTSDSQISQYDKLPDPSLETCFDNDSWEIAMESDSVIECMNLIGDIMDDYTSFDGKPYLHAEPNKVEAMQQRFAHIKKPLVGISWRSSIVNYNRIEHYLLIDDIINLFAVEGVQFVKLQYGALDWELAEVEEKHPGKLLDFPDIDQFNDFETTAALMECMDLIISPATTVIEFAGALGRPAWMISNSAELHWRKNPSAGYKDVWHNSIEHVEGKAPGDKAGLVEALISKLKLWSVQNEFITSQ